MNTTDAVRALLADLADPPASDTEALELDSLTIVRLVEALEDRFGIRIAAKDVLPANFGTIATVAAYVDRVRK
jgi:acyl carrier protein